MTDKFSATPPEVIAKLNLHEVKREIVIVGGDTSLLNHFDRKHLDHHRLAGLSDAALRRRGLNKADIATVNSAIGGLLHNLQQRSEPKLTFLQRLMNLLGG